jgi:hypothetical protein
MTGECQHRSQAIRLGANEKADSLNPTNPASAGKPFLKGSRPFIKAAES